MISTKLLTFFFTIFLRGGNQMPETTEVREKIAKWKEDNNVSYQQIALMIGKHKPEVHAAITGVNKGPAANQIILKIIQMFDIK